MTKKKNLTGMLLTSTIICILIISLCSAENYLPPEPVFETSFQIPEIKKDHFLAEVWVYFKSSRGETIRIPAFYNGDGIWKVRFSPVHIGKYSLSFKKGVPGNEKIIKVKHLKQKEFINKKAYIGDFVRLDKNRIQRFKFDNNQSYFPMGINCTMSTWSKLYTMNMDLYRNYFIKMRETGFNYVRIMATVKGNRCLFDRFIPQGDPLVTEKVLAMDQLKPELFDLDVAEFWDKIFYSARKNNIRIQVCLDHQYAGSRKYCLKWDKKYKKRMQNIWAKSSWNITNEGFLTHPREIFSHPKAIELFKARNRYFIARWGYSPALMSLEIANEPGAFSIAKENPDLFKKWHRIMIDYIRKIDPYKHLITTGTEKNIVYPFTDYYQPHIYPTIAHMKNKYSINKLDKKNNDIMFGVTSHFNHGGNRNIPKISTGNPWNLDKPIFWGEMGINKVLFEKMKVREDAHEDRDDAFFIKKGKIERRMLWESLFSGGAGAGMLWDNEGWLLKYDHFPRFKTVCEFVKFSRIPDQVYQPVDCHVGIKNVYAYAMVSDKSSVGYIFHKDRWDDDNTKLSPLKGSLKLQVKQPGIYKIFWWDTTQGRVLKEASQKPQKDKKNYYLYLKTPEFKQDMAVSVQLNPH